MKILSIGVAAMLWMALPAKAAEIEKGEAAMNAGDFAAALEHWLPLAEMGHPLAQQRLGELYIEGICYPQSYENAAKWYSKSAEQGHAQSQVQLGDLYAKGLGVPKDPDMAKKLYRQASDQGNEMARNRLEKMAN